MDRMTYICDLDGISGVGLRDGVTGAEAICRLAEYEDAGLEPEEVTDYGGTWHGDRTAANWPRLTSTVG